ncbi:DUF2339 domain-containing protein [Pseudacidobacterium ailaaui]|jgi:uncharacterized membrane protein|uniref:DUF2339 domain-containing protein n=1 Tax=Pseudacidobacterium ailaaui TaxID=1382359 RepID=UPI000478BFFC|nr:DUF2339 domain-containing protein [Pseudacidobacterium ailaaui]
MDQEFDALRKQIQELTARVSRLEELQKSAATDPGAPSDIFEPKARMATSGDAAVEAKKRTSSAGASLESRIGAQVFNRIGIFAVLIGMAWFLKFAMDNHWIRPGIRIVIGLMAGTGIILWSERFRRKGYSAFAYSLKAIGSGILYLALWAACTIYQLLPVEVAFTGMLLVTVCNGFMSWFQNAELLALYAMVGGLATPLLLANNEDHELVLFGYLLLLDLTALGLIFVRPWTRLILLAFAGTGFYGIVWYLRFYEDPKFGITVLFSAVFFVLFAVAPALMSKEGAAGINSRLFQGQFLLLLLPLVNAALGSFEFYVLLDHSGRNWVRPWAAVFLALFYFVLAKVPIRQKIEQGSVLLDSVHQAIAVVFLTIAIPLKACGRWIPLGWLAEGAALLWVAHRQAILLLRYLSVGILTIGLFALVLLNPSTGSTLILNAQFATYLAGIAAFGMVARIATVETKRGQDKSWAKIAAGSIIAVNMLVMIAVCLQIHFYWQGRGQDAWDSFGLHRMYAQFTYSAWTMFFGAVLLALGFWRQSALLRWQALVFIAGSIGKVFLVDTSQLSQGYRVLSFLGLGAFLLAVSFVYQRNWLNLRRQGPTGK